MRTCWKESAARMSLWIASQIDGQCCTETAGGGSKSVADNRMRGQSVGIVHLTQHEFTWEDANKSCCCRTWSAITLELLTPRNEFDHCYLGPEHDLQWEFKGVGANSLEFAAPATKLDTNPQSHRRHTEVQQQWDLQAKSKPWACSNIAWTPCTMSATRSWEEEGAGSMMLMQCWMMKHSWQRAPFK